MQGKNKRSSTRSKGLGDTIAKVTSAKGIDKLVHFVAGEDCGCDERRKKLNALFPYRQTLCLTEQEFKTLTAFFESEKVIIRHPDQLELLAIYNRVFGSNRKPTTCGSCFRQVVKDLKQVMGEYAESDNSTG